MQTRSDPELIFEEIWQDFSSVEQFDELVRSSAFYYQEHGPLNILKIFIPNKRQNADGYAYLHDWTPEMAEQAAQDIIKFFTITHEIGDSYLKEVAHDGIYLAFTTATSDFLTFNRYIGNGIFLIEQGGKNGVKITADEWLRDFPYEFNAAWHNRSELVNTITPWLDEPENELFKKAMYDGRQNWLEGKKYSKIENWNPRGKFIRVFIWEFNDTEQDIKKMLADFKADFN